MQAPAALRPRSFGLMRSIPPPDPVEAAIAALPGSLRALADRGIPRRYRKNVTLIEEGSQGDTLHLVLIGKVKACSIDHRDREIIYGVYGPGDYVGEMSLDGGPRSASVITLEPTTCLVLTRASLLAHIAEHPEFAFELLARVIQRARLATASARSMALLDVYGRLRQLLLALSVREADQTRWIAERPTHADFAARVGCSREMISRLLKDLYEGSYLRNEGQGLRLLRDPPSAW